MKLKNNRDYTKLKRNIISSAMYQILVMIVPIITTPYITRIFNSAQMGEYSLSLTIAGFFVVISNFGLNLYGSREVAKTTDLKSRSTIFFNLWSTQIFFSFIMCILYNILFIFVFSVNDRMLYFIQSALIIINIFDISWFFIGIEEIRRTILRNMIMKIFTTVAILIFVKDGNQMHLFSLVNVLGMLLGNISMISMIWKYIDFKYIKFHLTWENIKQPFKLLAPQIITSSYGTIERSVLKIVSNNQNVGMYDQGQKIINLVFSVLNASLSALMPRMSYHVSKNELDKVKYYLHKGLDYTTKFSTIVVSGILVSSDNFVSFFYGPGYDNVSIVLKITGLSLVFVPTSVFLSSGLMIPLKKDKDYLISIILTVLTGLTLNLILNFKFGLIGASFAYLFSQLIGFVYKFISLRNYLDTNKVLLNLIITIVIVISNVFLINSIANVVIISSPFISFMLSGTGSVILNICLLWVVEKISIPFIENLKAL